MVVKHTYSTLIASAFIGILFSLNELASPAIVVGYGYTNTSTVEFSVAHGLHTLASIRYCFEENESDAFATTRLFVLNNGNSAHPKYTMESTIQYRERGER